MRVAEVLLMVGHIFHHLKTLTHVTLDVHVHEDGADEASDEDPDIRGQLDGEILSPSENDDAEDSDEGDLDEENLKCRLESAMHIIGVQLHLLHRLVVEGLVCHRVGVLIDVEALAVLHRVIKKLLTLFLDGELFLIPQLDLKLLHSGLVRVAWKFVAARNHTKTGATDCVLHACAHLLSNAAGHHLFDNFFGPLGLPLALVVHVVVHEVVGSLGHIKEDIKRNVDSIDDLLARACQVDSNHCNVSDQVDNPGPFTTSNEDFLHPDIMLLFLLLRGEIIVVEGLVDLVLFLLIHLTN